MLRAATKAECLLEDFNLKAEPPINLESVYKTISSKKFEISLKEEPMETEGFLGVSILNKKGATILINAKISNAHRKRFTIAHEIGHVYLHSSLQRPFQCTSEHIFANSDNYQYEKEANEFASALLMPSFAVSKLINSSDVSWLLVQKISTLCDVSLQAAARRIVCLSNDPCCLIIHNDKQMWTPIKSSSFTGYLPNQTFPKNLERQGSLEECTFDECDFSDWSLDNTTNGKLYYSSLDIPSFNQIMTLLIYDEYADIEEDPIEPHF